MRPLSMSVAAVALVFFILSSVNLYNSWQQSQATSYMMTTVKGFEDSGTDTENLKQLRKEFSDKILYEKEKSDSNEKYALIVNFIVTVLTAGATLISAIASAKNKENVPTKTVTLIAIIAFFSTIANWGNGKLNEAHTKHVGLIEKTKTLRSEFITVYEKETDPQKKDNLINTYRESLREI